MCVIRRVPFMCGCFVVLCVGWPALAADLIVDGSPVTLSGSHTFENVQVINGGTLLVAPYDGSPGTGLLRLFATNLVVDAASSISADARGFRGLENADGEGPGGGEGGDTVFDGGGGGGHGGRGGNGVLDEVVGFEFDGDGGLPYGNACSIEAQLGSAGGSAGTRDGDFGGVGGNGGGAIWLEAPSITVMGTVTANGGNGAIFVNDSSGGGAGGSILFIADAITVSGSVSADGGSGGTTCGGGLCELDDGGGGGGGGRVKMYYGSLSITGDVTASGGPGAGKFGAEAGEDGTTCQVAMGPSSLDVNKTARVDGGLCRWGDNDLQRRRQPGDSHRPGGLPGGSFPPEHKSHRAARRVDTQLVHRGLSANAGGSGWRWGLRNTRIPTLFV